MVILCTTHEAGHLMFGDEPSFASGFGDLSIHEFAVDQQSSRLAYSSYYAGGARALSYGSNGLSEVGAFIDEGGNNFWGVEDMDIRGKGHHGGGRYFALSDRDYGLFILRYTG
jgi:hypothetical protein